MITDKRRGQKALAQKRYKQSAKGVATQQRYYKSDAKKLSSKRWREKPENVEKFKAHRLVDKAIKLGFLKRLPCNECGNKNAFAHHDNYSKPLEVEWLCNLHHSELHRSK